MFENYVAANMYGEPFSDGYMFSDESSASNHGEPMALFLNIKNLEDYRDKGKLLEYGDKGKSYRIYTIVEKNGKNICVGIDVNRVGRDVNITNIRTAFARDIANALNERLVYPHSRSELETAIREHSLRHNREVYPEQPNDSANVAESSGHPKLSGEKIEGGRKAMLRLDGVPGPVMTAAERRRLGDATYRETFLPRMIEKYTGFDENEFYGTLADEYEKGDGYGERGKDSVGEGEVGGDAGGGSILHGTPASDAEGGGLAGQGQPGGEVHAGLRSGDAEGVVVSEARDGKNDK